MRLASPADVDDDPGRAAHGECLDPGLSAHPDSRREHSLVIPGDGYGHDIRKIGGAELGRPRITEMAGPVMRLRRCDSGTANLAHTG